MAKKTVEPIDITPEDSAGPVYLIPLTEDQEAERKQWENEQLEREVAEQTLIKAKESAIAKLVKLGLTEEEANAFIS